MEEVKDHNLSPSSSECCFVMFSFEPSSVVSPTGKRKVTKETTITTPQLVRKKLVIDMVVPDEGLDHYGVMPGEKVKRHPRTSAPVAFTTAAVFDAKEEQSSSFALPSV